METQLFALDDSYTDTDISIFRSVTRIDISRSVAGARMECGEIVCLPLLMSLDLSQP